MSYDDDDDDDDDMDHAPFETKDSNEFRFVNCCNGLICFAKDFEEGMDQIFICNPVTKEVISLPSAEKREHSWVTYGLGFSPATEEYKVIDLTVRTKALIRKWAPVAIVIGIVILLFWVKKKIW